MAIRHILNDGTEVPAITGRRVLVADHREMYGVVESIKRKEQKKDESVQGLRQRYEMPRISV